MLKNQGEYQIYLSFTREVEGKEQSIVDISFPQTAFLGNPYQLFPQLFQEWGFDLSELEQCEKLRITLWKNPGSFSKEDIDANSSIKLHEVKIILGYGKTDNILSGIKIGLTDENGNALAAEEESVQTSSYAGGVRYIGANKLIINNLLANTFPVTWYQYSPTTLIDEGGGKFWKKIDTTENSVLKLILDDKYNSTEIKAISDNVESNIIKITKQNSTMVTSKDTIVYTVQDSGYGTFYPLYDQTNNPIVRLPQPKITILGFANITGTALEAVGVSKYIVTWKVPRIATMLTTLASQDKFDDTFTRTWEISQDQQYLISTIDISKDSKFIDYAEQVLTLQVGLKQLYSATARNNNIICEIERENEIYTVSIPFSFSSIGSNGTGLYLDLELDRAALTGMYGNNDNNGRIAITAKLYDSNGIERSNDYDEEFWYNNLSMTFEKGTVDIVKDTKDQIILTKIGHRNFDDGVFHEMAGDIVSEAGFQNDMAGPDQLEALGISSSEPAAARTYLLRSRHDVLIYSQYYCVVKATLKLDDGLVLTTRRAIPYQLIADDNFDILLEGPTKIVYDNFGNLSKNYLIPMTYTIYQNGEKIISPELYLRYPKQDSSEFAPQIEYENTSPPTLITSIKEEEKIYSLSPSSIAPRNSYQGASIAYFDRGENYNFYIHPLLIEYEVYENETVNLWDGSTTQDEDSIMSVMIGAGKKDSENLFSGVLMGEVNNRIGLYGYSQGLSSFGFDQSGSCWIGPNKEIQFNSGESSLNLTASKLLINVDGENGYFKVDSENAYFEIGSLTWSEETNSYLKYTPEQGLQLKGQIDATEGGQIANWKIKKNMLVASSDAMAGDGSYGTVSLSSLSGEEKIEASYYDYGRSFFRGMTNMKSIVRLSSNIVIPTWVNSSTFASIPVAGIEIISQAQDDSNSILRAPNSLSFSSSFSGGSNWAQILNTPKNNQNVGNFPTLSIDCGRIRSSDKNSNYRIQIGVGDLYNGESTRNARILLQSYAVGGISAISLEADSISPSASVQDISDIKKKNSITPLSQKYSIFFDNLVPTSYKYNNGKSNRLHVGFIAQEVLSALEKADLTSQEFGGLVIDAEDNWYLRYAEFVALNTNEIQKLKARVTELENKLREKGEINNET